MDIANHSLTLTPENIEYLRTVEASINHWSRELGATTLKLRGCEIQLAGVYDSRESYLRKQIEDAGFSPNKIMRMQVNNQGILTFTLQEENGPQIQAVPEK